MDFLRSKNFLLYISGKGIIKKICFSKKPFSKRQEYNMVSSGLLIIHEKMMKQRIIIQKIFIKEPFLILSRTQKKTAICELVASDNIKNYGCTDPNIV